jgi:3-oxoacyl-[acyl-carrier-protein] synthase II
LGEAVAAAIGRPAVLRCYSTACAAGNFAISAGVTLLRRGRIDVAVAGGVDAFSRIALAGFSRSRAMTPDLCRPFDAGRRGMQLGEAAAFLILEREDDARRRGATVIARVHEAGLSCDAYHSTAPEPSGAGMVTAMREALAYANIQPDAVAFVCAHGSGTRASDSAEALAIARVFGPGARVFGIKGALGHSMGAASAVEAAVTALALRDSRIPPTTNSVDLEKGLDIDLVTEPRSAPGARYALSNAFGFGGINSALLLEAV